MLSFLRQPLSGKETAATPPPREGYVQLDRRFSELPKTSDRDDAADESYLYRVWSGRGRFDWAALLKKPLVVVLGEQGSGKSWEIEHQAACLTAQGKFAFYLRLEELVNHGVDSILGTGAAAFERWKRGNAPATFFLDSVDESKLSGPEAFHTALRRFRDTLPAGFAARTGIVLSSRVSEWHPETDGTRVREYFGITDRREKREADEDNSETKATGPELLVVQINPLERDQVAALARAKGYPRVDEFLRALDDAHAWEFARRPIDVMALVGFWQQHARIGTLTELIEFDLGRNLRERRTHMPDTLGDGDARLGAETLAAGAVFCGEPNIRVADANAMVTGLDGLSCLPPGFTAGQHNSLLARAVFDGASFGRVRFHHRRVREYLAAAWVNRLMAGECSLAELDGLFFDHIGGERVLRASRAAVAAWLCAGGQPWNVTMRRWVLECAPDLPLRYGDPRSLPLDFKQAVLARLVQSAQSRSHLWLDTDRDALGRLADPALVPQITAIIRDPGLATDLRAAMIEIVRHGRLAACLPTILDVVSAADAPDDLKIYAVAAIREVNDRPSIVQLATIARHLPQVSPSFTDLLVEALFPMDLGVDDLLALLRKTRERGRRLPDLRWQIKGTLAERLNAPEAGPLLAKLVQLLAEEPHFPSERGEPAVSQEFAWLRPLLSVALTKVLAKPALTYTEVTDAATALAYIGSLRERELNAGDEKSNLQALTLAHPTVRQGYFWPAIERRRPMGLHAIDHPMDVFSRYEGHLEPAQSDVDWLLEDLLKQPGLPEREVALMHAMQWFNDLGRPWRLRWRIHRAIAGHPALLARRRELARLGRTRALQRYFYRFQHHYHHHRRKGEKVYGWIAGRVNWVRNHWFFWRNHEAMARGEFMNAVHFLLRQAERENKNHLAVANWSAAERKWGHRPVTAARAACKSYWRTHPQQLPHECVDTSSIPNGLVVGLSGLHAAWTDGEFDTAGLTDEDVKTATRYAMREINGFPPWFQMLAEQRPVQVGQVLAEAIAGEWDAPASRQRPFDGLQRLAWHAAPLMPPVRELVLSRLQAGDPEGRALGLILGYLVRSPAAPLAELEALAQIRLSTAETPIGAVALWFAVWLQINPMAAIAGWQAHVSSRAVADQAMVLAASALQDRDLGQGPRLAAPAHRTVAILRALLPLVFAHVKPTEDIDHTDGGGYSPGARDHAQEFRSFLLRELTDSEEATAADTLLELSALPEFSTHRDRLLHLRDENLKQRADRERWEPGHVRQFALEQETEPRTDRDLYRIVTKRLGDMKEDVERSDLGLRTQLRPGDHEVLLRIWLANELIRRSRQRYTVPQEAVIDLNQRPDIRLENPRTDAVSLEVKWAQDWSFNELVEALEVQLLGQYLRAHNSRHGVLILGMHDGNRGGWDPSTGGRLRFTELVAAMQAKARELERSHPEAKQLSVVGIDFRAPTP